MFLEDLFFRLPVRDTYRETDHKAVFLRAHPTVARLCFLVEVCVCIAIFAYSYQITADTGTTETKVSYEPIDGYDCEVLSPLSTSVEYSTESSEIAQFSKMRWTYDECIEYTGSGDTGYDLCSDDNRDDYLLSVYGIQADDTVCGEKFLADGYRLCYSHAKETKLQSSLISTSFPTVTTPTDIPLTSDGFFFINGTHIHILKDVPFDESDFLTSYVTDYNKNVFIIASRNTDSKNFLYRLTVGEQAAVQLYELGAEFSAIYGMTYKAATSTVYAMAITGTTAHILYYDLSTSTGAAPSSLTWGCDNLQGAADTSSSSSSNFLSLGSNGKLYAMCTADTSTTSVTNGVAVTTSRDYIFYEIDPSTSTQIPWTVDIFSQNFTASDGSNSKHHVTTITRVMQSSHYLYFFTNSEYSNVFRVDMLTASLSTHKLVNVEYIGQYSGNSVIEAPSNQFYFTGGTHQYYNPLTNTFNINIDKSNDYYYYGIYTQLAYSYQICNSNYSQYIVDYSLSTSFYKLCDDVNG